MYNNENKFNTEVPIQDKVLLTFPQAAKYGNGLWQGSTLF